MGTKPIKANYFVKKDNELTQALFYDMTVTAYRIILLASSDKFLEQIKKNPLAPIRISPTDYHDLYGNGIDASPAYRALKKSVDELLDAKLRFRQIKAHGESGHWIGGTNWIDTAKYNSQLKVLEITFTPGIIPMILDVQSQYTYYNLRHIAKLGSIQSMRMYELMMRWRKRKSTPVLSVAYMRTWCGVPDGKYEDLKDFNKCVIKKAAKEITDKTDIEVEYSQITEGKTTKEYVFTMTYKNETIEGEAQESSVGTQGELPLDDDGLPQLGF